MPFAKINDIDLHFEMHGSGPPLLLVHGLGASCLDWEHQVAAFGAHFQMIVPSLRGFGRTTRLRGPFTIRQFAHDVLALLDHLGIGCCHVLGFSMGGAVTFQLVLDAPERFQTLIILNSLPSFRMDTWRKRFMVASRIAIARLLGMPRLVRILATRSFPEVHQKALRELVIARHSSNDMEAYLGVVRDLPRWSVADRLHELRMPVLVITADMDYTGLAEKEAFVARLDDARLVVIRDSRHVSYLDQPAAFNRVVLDFLLAQDGEGDSAAS